MNKILKKDFIIVIIVSAVIVLPFINQAYYIDDFIYLSAAIQYNESGFDSFRGMSDQEGYVFPNYYFTHPLLWPYLIAKFISLFNTTSEITLHLLPLISLIITGFASLIIAKRYSSKPLVVTLLFLVLPGLMLLSHVIMTDLPTLAFFLLALAFHIKSVENESLVFSIASGLSAAVSCGISYQALFIIPLIIFYNIQHKHRSFVYYLPAVIPFLFFGLWFIYTWIEFGIPHPLVSFQWADMADRNIFDGFLEKFVGNINSLGAATIFPVFVILVYFRSGLFRKISILSFIIALPFLFSLTSNYSMIQRSLFLLYFTTGILLVFRILILFYKSLKERNKKNIFLTIWFICFGGAIVILMPLGVARYLLPCFLPLVIIFINDLNKLFDKNEFKYAATAGLIITGLWGFLCSYADYTLAGTYRDFAQQIKMKYPDKNIWFSSDGLQWYMKSHGYKPLLYDDSGPKQDDIIVISKELWPYYVPEVMERSEFVAKIPYYSFIPVRTMNRVARAGFYDHYPTLLPFSLSNKAFEEFSIYKVLKNSNEN